MAVCLLPRATARGRCAGRPAWLAAGLLLTSCIYDSRWGDAKTAQKNAAQHYSGAQLGAGQAAAPRLAKPEQDVRKLRLVTLVTPEHAAQVVNWQKRFAEAVERANPVLGSSLQIELTVVEGGFWRPESNPDDLTALLVELERTHPAADMEWVIGLVGSLSRLEMSFHRLGVGRLHGKHLIVRAANDALEYDAIEKSYSELSPSERDELYRSRRAHQASAVLIHELGHCLGAVHVRAPTDLMHETYSTEAASFDDAVARLMRITLDQRLRPPPERNAQQMAEQIEQELDRAKGLWVPEEEREMRAYLASLAGASPGAQTTSAQPAAPVMGQAPGAAAPAKAEVPAVAGLSDAEQELFGRVLQQKSEGRADEAWATAEPLFRDHSDLRPIAELRCQLAMDRGGDYSVIRKECAPLLGQSSGFER
jgi:hypothetical protein